ncbi:MAG: hypothetical protein EBT75_00015 [Proteobacteria bacterium]|nr:hypothetical protein [Pseudomonadota bacterium]
MKKKLITKQNKALLKSWFKVAVAAAIASYMAGTRDWTLIADAALVAVLPVIHTWFDKSDKRFGRNK